MNHNIQIQDNRIVCKSTVSSTNFNKKIQVSEISSNIVGTSIGKKITNSVLTDQISFIFYVNKKLPISDISPEEIITNTIIIDNITYVTDVIEVNQISFLGCYDWSSNQTTITQEQNNHRVLVRPLQCGVSVVNSDDLSNTAGTLGLLARDLTDNSLVGLTNAHVVCKNLALLGKNPSTSRHDVSNIYSKQVSQPAPIDQTINDPFIGQVKRYLPIQNFSTIDAALIHINPDIQITHNQLNLTTDHLLWANDTEINSIVNQNIVLSKSGRTTGSIGGIAGCPIRALAINANIWVGAYNLNDFYFTDCISIAYTNFATGVSVGGDSGSAVIGNFNGVQKVIGLLFAGGSFPEISPHPFNVGFVCRITRIAELLKIGPLDININNINYGSPSNWKYKISNHNLAKDIDKTIIDGKTYYQIGNTFID